jgi:hypothetical protein
VGEVRVLVCGGRDYADRERLNVVLDRLRVERGFSVVIVGGARGADTLAAEWADGRGLPCEVYMADWQGLGTKAGRIRNERMLSDGKPALVVAFPGGRGTAHMAGIARGAGVEVIEIPSSFYMIDEPSPFSPLQEWHDHLRYLRAIDDPYAPMVKQAIEFALATIRWTEARESEAAGKPNKAC